jgi:hypothetical protein
MYMIIGSLLTFFGMYLTKKLSKTEKYSREELESDLLSLIKEMEEDGILQQTT